MQKKSWMDRPITWGAYLKLCLWASVIGVSGVLWTWQTMFRIFDPVVDWFGNLLDRMRNKNEE